MAATEATEATATTRLSGADGWSSAPTLDRAESAPRPLQQDNDDGGRVDTFVTRAVEEKTGINVFGPAKDSFASAGTSRGSHRADRRRAFRRTVHSVTYSLRLRVLALVERGGLPAFIFLKVVPIWINVFWLVLYFVERQNDVFHAGGPCQAPNYNGTMSPFFVTGRSMSTWSVQVIISAFTIYCWCPVRWTRDHPTRLFSFMMELFIDFITCVPFLFSVLFIPAYQAYVPTFFRYVSTSLIIIASNVYHPKLTSP